MARRRRISPIGQFTQNLMAGVQLGFQHADRREAIAARRDAILAAREKAAAQAEYNRQRLGIDAMKAGAYAKGVDADVLLKTAKAGAVGKGGGGEAGISPGLKEYFRRNGGMPPGGETEAAPASVAPVEHSEPSTADPPASSTDSGGLGEPSIMARGGKVQQMRRGGRPNAGDAFGGAMMTTMRTMDYMDRAQQRRDAAPKPAPTITRGASTPVPQPSPDVGSGTGEVYEQGGMVGGTTGPGSGYGMVAAPPPNMVPRMQFGGTPPLPRPLEMPGRPSPGTVRPQSPLLWLSNMFGATPPPAAAGAQPPRGLRGPPEGGDDTGYSGSGRSASGEPVRDWPAAEGGASAVPPPRAPGRGGGGGYQARGGMLGDQRRTTAYDPEADRNDPRNIGVANSDGSVNARTYDLAARGQVQMPLPNQQPFRRGGAVHRFKDGGKEDGEGGGNYLLEPSGDRPAARFDVGKKGSAYVGGLYHPFDRVLSGEAGYEHRFDNGVRAGIHGNADKYIGPGGEHEKPNFGGGIRIRVPFQQGGPVPHYRTGGSGQRLPVPASGREWVGGQGSSGEGGVGMPPQGGGEPATEDQLIEQQLDAQLRDEAYKVAQASQQQAAAAPRSNPQWGPMPPSPPFQGDEGRADERSLHRQGGYGDAPVDVPELPERDPAWARRPAPPFQGDEGRADERSLHRQGGYGPGASPPAFQGEEARATENRVGPPGRLTNVFDKESLDWRIRRSDRGPHDKFVGEEARADETPRPRQGAAPPVFQGEEARADETPRPRPGGAPPARPGAARPAAPQGPSAGQEEADRLTRDYPQGQAAPQPGAPAAIATKPPMQQGVGEPQGGYGLAGPGENISTNNAARDYLSGATNFANWAMKDAGPQNKDQATAALFSGKGAATLQEMGSVFMAVDPDSKMPLDKRMELAGKTLHDFFMAKGDVKQASEAAFQVAQFGVTKSREHGVQALKALKGGDEQGALKELLAGYAWLPDKGSASVKDGSIVVTGDDGKVRVQIPLQPGTVQNLAMGMMSGQLGWDAIRGGAAAGGAPPAPTQGVNASYPAAGNQPSAMPPGRQPWDEKPDRGARTWPVSGTPAQPPAAPAGPAQPPAAPTAQKPPTQGIEPVPPTTRPATASQSAAPTATRPPSSQSPQTPAASGSQAPAKKGVGEAGAGAGVDLDGRPEAPPAKAPPTTKGGGFKEVVPDAPPRRTTGGGVMTDDEKKYAPLYKDNPFKVPNEIARQHAPEPPEMGRLNEQLKRLEATRKAQRHQAETDAELLTPKEQGRWVGKKIAEIEKEYSEQRKILLGERTRLLNKQSAADTHEANVVLAPRKLSLEDNTKLKTAFSERAKAIDEAKGRDGKVDSELDKYRKRTVLRYKLTDEERAPVYEIARELLRHNDSLDAESAVENALVMTAILPEGKSRVNYQSGEKALEWRPLAGNLARGMRVQTSRGSEINVDPVTYGKIVDMFKDNWSKFNNKAQTDKDEAARLARLKTDLGSRALDLTVRGMSLLVPGAAEREAARLVTGDRK